MNSPLNVQDSSAPSACNETHLLTFPFPLTSRPDGGLPTVILNEVANSGGRKVVMFTKDEMSHADWQGVKLVAGEPGAMPPELFQSWFGTGYWAALHPKAHTSEGLTHEAVMAMYPKDKREALLEKLEAKYAAEGRPITEVPQVGTPEFLLHYINEYAPPRSVNEAFNDTFREAIRDELSEQERQGGRIHFNFQDYFFSPTVERFAPQVRELGGRSTYHLHTTIPDLPETEPLPIQIIDLARGASKADVVLTHTEIYNERLRRIFNRLGITPPELRTFALGIDEQDLAHRQEVITPDNYRETIPSLSSMTPRQQAFVHAAFDAERGGVAHQFGIFDRIDPGKGLDAVFPAIDKFLSRARSHMSLDSMREKFRFFALMVGLPSHEVIDTIDLRPGYVWHVKQMGDELERKWPGIFFMAEGLSGQQRELICALMRGRTVITGGAEDGLNQVVMESAFINRDKPTAIIAGSNIGFVMEMDRSNLKQALFHFAAGNVDQIVGRMAEVIMLQRHNPDTIVRSKRDVVKAIEARRDSMLVRS